ncbi:hypothetical protein BT96DRAFT_926282 [Gymnopus androsaceus JB14]|uniref:Uncharacterized protein n=1 Tax=Gymnopus androsaceus JB14 TaxID=1447944 RepID=A0A6A4GVJ1_9AGAR|nr:hypothetical protein BT96DRAFT_926282 [Gymnopus androsaceus JB14]
MSNPNTIVVFGPSPDSYYVGHGRLHFVENMSPSFTDHAKTTLNISFSKWISMSKAGNTWIEYNNATNKFYFNTNLNQNIQDQLAGNVISFPDSEDNSHYFSTGKSKGQWNAVLPDHFSQQLLELQREVPNFDIGIAGMLFGKGKTGIFLFEAGFYPSYDQEDITSEDHPLYKALVEFGQLNSGWCIQPDSTLCFYDSRFFFLKFKRAGENTIQLRSNLPTHIAAKLEELKELAQKPEEQIALMQQDNTWNQVMMMRISNQMTANMMVGAATRAAWHASILR